MTNSMNPNHALRRAYDLAWTRLNNTAGRITDASRDPISLFRNGGEPTWEDVQIIETAEYLLNVIFHYVDSGKATDTIDITWEGEDKYDS